MTNTLYANAGSILIFFSDTGTRIPNKPATIILSTIDIPINIDKFVSLNQSWTINAGMQTLAVTIRAIAKKELSTSNFNRIVGKEFLIGILNGIIFAVITALIVQLWFNEISLAILIGISMILNMIVAGLFGILVPVSLKKLNIDPALASSVFVTTITDVIGFLSFLGLGSYYFLN